MKERYQIYEDKKTYLLEIDHDKREFAVGSVSGKKSKKEYTTIDESGYKAQISRIGIDYKCLGNCLV